MSEAGYDPREAAKIWLELMKEKAAGDTESHPSIFFSTHPSSEERSETLARRAKEMPAATVGTKLGRERFKAMTLAYRKHWLRDEIRRKEFSRFEVVLAGLRRAGDRLGEIDFFQGETHRLRNDEGDPEKAMIAYKKALRDDGSPVETHRSLGLVQWSLGLKADARSSFSRYLLIKPDADDRRMIESYIEQLAVTRH